MNQTQTTGYTLSDINDFYKSYNKMYSPRISMVLFARYCGMSLGDVGSLLGMTRERVRQVESKGLEAIKQLKAENYE